MLQNARHSAREANRTDHEYGSHGVAFGVCELGCVYELGCCRALRHGERGSWISAEPAATCGTGFNEWARFHLRYCDDTWTVAFGNLDEPWELLYHCTQQWHRPESDLNKLFSEIQPQDTSARERWASFPVFHKLVDGERRSIFQLDLWGWKSKHYRSSIFEENGHKGRHLRGAGLSLLPVACGGMERISALHQLVLFRILHRPRGLVGWGTFGSRVASICSEPHQGSWDMIWKHKIPTRFGRVNNILHKLGFRTHRKMGSNPVNAGQRRRDRALPAECDQNRPTWPAMPLRLLVSSP